MYDHSLWGGFGEDFFPVPASVCDSLNWNSLQIASFERRLREVAQTPLALPNPFRTWPGSGAWAEQDKRKVHTFLFFGRVYARAILGSWHNYAELERKNI